MINAVKDKWNHRLLINWLSIIKPFITLYFFSLKGMQHPHEYFSRKQTKGKGRQWREACNSADKNPGLISCMETENGPTSFATGAVSASFIHRAHNHTAFTHTHTPVRVQHMHDASLCVRADGGAHLVVQVKQVWGETCLTLPIHQVAAV